MSRGFLLGGHPTNFASFCRWVTIAGRRHWASCTCIVWRRSIRPPMRRVPRTPSPAVARWLAPPLSNVGRYQSLKFEPMPPVAAAFAFGGLPGGGSEALECRFAGAGLGSVPAPSLRAVGAALVVAVE